MGGLPAPVLTQGHQRGRERVSHAHRLLAGIELVEIPAVAQLNADQMHADCAAVLAGAPDGVVLSWDLWRMPLERLDMVKALYRHPTTR
jgi:hypothetical protein